MYDHRFKLYLLTSDWFKKVFEEVYGDKCRLWFAGIPLEEWSDVKLEPKTIDVLIYDKIRWGKEAIRPLFVEPIEAYLTAKGLSYKILKYGEISHEVYRDYLSKSKSMLFLCESETQGMAYQEALASNIPVLAWDPGWWVDPVWLVFSTKPIPASSVPYFSPQCGEKFSDVRDFYKTFELFWKNIKKYEPRDFIKNNLSLEKSGKLYADYYFGLLK